MTVANTVKRAAALYRQTVGWLSLIRLTPFDVTTESGRARERYRRAALTSLASIGAKGVAVLTALVSVPLTLRYLGAERYGLWMTIASFEAFLILMNFGLGHGLLGVIAQAYGNGDHRQAQTYISSAFFFLAGLALVSGLVFAGLYPSIAWSAIFKVTSLRAQAEAGPALAVFVLCWLVDIPLALVQQVQLGYQQGFANSLWQALASGLSLVSVVVAAGLQLELPWLVLALAGPPVLIHFLQCLVFFGFQSPTLRPTARAVTLSAARYLARLGFLFFVLQIVQVLAMASDNLIAAQTLGPEAVAELSVAARLFGLPLALVSLLFTPLWPAYSEAIARKEFDWVHQTLWRSLRLAGVAAGLPVAVLVIWGGPLITWWASPSVTPSPSLLAGLGLWTLLLAVGSALAMFLNGANVVKIQVIWASLFAAAALIGKVTWAQFSGVAGIVWAGVAAYLLLVVIPYSILIPRLLRRLRAGQHV